ncbi:MAG: TonB-dependent receptor [Hylemonella sp.]|uniref:TonB-dependent receptor plug domain-containing protein n=1 Tax=Hylemonella sp. TaxID=2066020 RepID=UPI0022CBF390|nr:TonB-dependent receptor [Hylemonella sp.]MCZ8251507.1 TonB-dependent receptor [Hylemonella sp.]
MKSCRQPSVLLLLYGLSTLAGAQSAAVSEKDYLDDVPVVLSVSRLPQRLDETPGAVTIIDRQMIRMSGARDVADLLRLVPGFRVTNSFESNTPQGSYHTTLSDYSNHIQVMVDGRSVYSTYLRGSTGPGLQTVALEDIERIEVYRGSNSAAYGARAFLGSINIVTRDLTDTQGTAVQLARGENGVADQGVRVGWGDDRARFRISADGRNDDGLQGTSGSSRVQRVNLRADVRNGPRDLLELRTGQSLIDAGVGFADKADNYVRTRRIETSYAQLDWRRNLDADQDLVVQASHTEEAVRDNFPYISPGVPRITVDFGGRAGNSNLSAQHTVRVDSNLRYVWGAELRREVVRSRPLYNTDASFSTDFTRLFSNVEWRLRPALLLNAGALLERSDLGGGNASPRVMLNWNAAEGHTLRAGYSRAFRPPSIYEKYANVRYFDGGVLLDSTYVSTGNVLSERVEAREFGYLFETPARDVTLDLRVFDERVKGLIAETAAFTQAGSGTLENTVKDYVNDESFRIRGYETQLNWRPWQGGRFVYASSRYSSGQSYGGVLVGRYGSHTLLWMQQLPRGWETSLSQHEADATRLPGDSNGFQPAYYRTDARVAKSLQIGGSRAQLALVGQSLSPAYRDFMPSFRVVRQVFVQLKVEH